MTDSDVEGKNIASILILSDVGIHIYDPSNVLAKIMPIYLVSPKSDLKQQKHEDLFPNKHLIGAILYLALSINLLIFTLISVTFVLSSLLIIGIILSYTFFIETDLVIRVSCSILSKLPIVI